MCQVRAAQMVCQDYQRHHGRDRLPVAAVSKPLEEWMFSFPSSST